MGIDDRKLRHLFPHLPGASAARSAPAGAAASRPRLTALRLGRDCGHGRAPGQPGPACARRGLGSSREMARPARNHRQPAPGRAGPQADGRGAPGPGRGADRRGPAGAGRPRSSTRRSTSDPDLAQAWHMKGVLALTQGQAEPAAAALARAVALRARRMPSAGPISASRSIRPAASRTPRRASAARSKCSRNSPRRTTTSACCSSSRPGSTRPRRICARRWPPRPATKKPGSSSAASSASAAAIADALASLARAPALAAARGGGGPDRADRGAPRRRDPPPARRARPRARPPGRRAGARLLPAGDRRSSTRRSPSTAPRSRATAASMARCSRTSRRRPRAGSGCARPICAAPWRRGSGMMADPPARPAAFSALAGLCLAADQATAATWTLAGLAFSDDLGGVAPARGERARHAAPIRSCWSRRSPAPGPRSWWSRTSATAAS